jgi:acyl carrier protein
LVWFNRSNDADLLGAGLLDSLALVDLLVNIEQEFGLEISLDTLEIDSFRSIDSIAEFIRSQQASKEMAA